jgi:hypothetical protein
VDLGQLRALQAEKPHRFTVGLIQRLPDDFMPPADVLALDAQAPGGKRKSLANMGPRKRLRSVLLAAPVGVAHAGGGCGRRY